MNIKLQEVTENGERSVRYKGRDGKYHNIAEGSQAPHTAQTGQSVTVGTVAIENGNPTITLDDFVPNRLYKIDSDNGSCLIATAIDGGLSIIGNNEDGLGSNVVGSIAQDTQGKWVIALSALSDNPVMTLLSDHDALMVMVQNHQSMLDDFLSYELLGSACFNGDEYIGNITYDTLQNSFDVCDLNLVGVRTLLNVGILIKNEHGSEEWLYSTVRLINRRAGCEFGAFFPYDYRLYFQYKGIEADVIAISVFKLTGVLGSLVNSVGAAHVGLFNDEYWREPENGDRIIVRDVEKFYVSYTISDIYYIDQRVELPGEETLLEFLCVPDNGQLWGCSCYVVVNGVLERLTVQQRNIHGEA